MTTPKTKRTKHRALRKGDRVRLVDGRVAIVKRTAVAFNGVLVVEYTAQDYEGDTYVAFQHRGGVRALPRGKR